MKKLLLFATLLTSLSTFAQTDLIISEYVEGWSNNKALEIYNPTDAAIDLSGYRITRYSNGSDVPPADNQWKIDLPAFSLEAYRSYVIVLDKRDPEGTGQEAPVWSQLQERADVFLCPVYADSKAMYFNGDDGVALEKTDGTLVDLFARWGAPRPAEATVGGSTLVLRCWTDTPPHFDGSGIGITADHTLVKKSNISSGITTNPTIWNPLADWDTLPANSFSGLGWHEFDGAPSNEKPVFGKNEYKFSINSDSQNGYQVGTITTTDKEGDEVKYYINYGNFIYIEEGNADVRVEPFSIDETSGAISLINQTGLDPTVKDTFNLKILATDGFSQTNELLVQVLVDIEIGVNDNFAKNTIQVWPNPTSTNNFTLTSNKIIKDVFVTNVIGQMVYNHKNIGQSTTNIYIGDAKSGIYFVNVITEDQSATTSKIVFK